MGVLDTIKRARRARRTIELILDAALEDEWLGLQSQLVAAADKDAETGSLARPATTELGERMEAIRDRVAASRVQFVFEGVPWEQRMALQVAHPAREGNRLDKASGYNIETFTAAIIRRACLGAYEGERDDEATPEPLPDESWEHLLGRPASDDQPAIEPALVYGQVDRLFAAALSVNDGVSRVPPSARSLLGTQDSGASLAQPGPGKSRRSGSKGGSRRGSPKSNATTPEVSSVS